MMAELERISIPLALGREAVTRSSRTNPGFCWDSAAELACDVAARNNNPNRTGRKLTTLFTQHLKGAILMVVPKDNASTVEWETS
jgi:hypothetical protein